MFPGRHFFILQMCSSTQGIGKPPPVSILICCESTNLKKDIPRKLIDITKTPVPTILNFQRHQQRLKWYINVCSWLLVRRILGQERLRNQTPTYCDIMCCYFWIVFNILLRCVIKIILLEIIVVIISQAF